MSQRPFRRAFRPGQLRADDAEDIHAEIELYLELRARELEEEGYGPEEARRIARERFGDREGIERRLRSDGRRRRVRQGTVMTMGGLRQDLTYALRMFRRSPGFTLIAVATLALALGGNTAIFSVVDASLLQALPFEDHDELVFLNGYHLTDGEVAIRGASFPEFYDWREASRAVSPMAATVASSVSLTGGEEAESLSAEFVTEDYFEVLGWDPLVGRTFLPQEHTETDAHSVAIISHSLWERRFGLDPSALGSDLTVNDRPLIIVGIMPAGFGGTDLSTDLWVPESIISLMASVEILESRGSRFLTVVGRLSPGADVATAQREMDQIAVALQQSFPRAHEDRFAQVEGFRDGYLGDTGGLLWILMGAGILLLIIASANVANLLLVRANGRTREFVLRRALGAEGTRVAAQLLTESLLLAVAGGIAGMGITLGALRVLGPMIPPGVLPGYVEPALSLKAFLVSLVVLGLVGVATGLVPAASSARMDIATRLREGARSVRGGNRFDPQHVFVVAQVALALVLLVGAGLLTRSFRAQMAVDTGADLEGVYAMRVELPSSRYDEMETFVAFATEVERGVLELPGVASVSLSSDLPFRGGSSGSYILREGDGPEDRIRFHRHSVTPAYFETLGIELVEGRFLDASDVDGATPVIVVTEALVQRVYPGERGVGKRMHLRPDGSRPVEIVGVVRDVRFRDVTTSLMADANSPDIFFSWWQMPSSGIEVAARLSGDVGSIDSAMRGVVAEIDRDLPVFQLEALSEGLRLRTATPRFAAFLMTLFSGLAAILACVGIYGVLTHAVGARTREIAIRRAIGASGANVATSVVVGGLRLAAVGLVVGGGAAMIGSRVLESFLFSVEPTDPITFLVVGGGMIAVAAVAAIVPALRATRRHPAEVLNSD